MRRLSVLIALVSVHCGGGGGGDVDARVDAPAVDAPEIDAPPIDARVDAPPIDAPTDAPPMACTGTVTFTELAPLDVGDPVYGMATGDANGDGHLDVFAGTFFDYIMVFLGRGDGTFATGARVNLNGGPRAIVATDVNGDGRLDLVTANFASENVEVLRGLGNGTFAFHALVDLGTRPSDVVVTHVDGDPYLDLLTANGLGTVSLIRGAADGEFLDPVSFPTYTMANGIVAMDVNVDGHRDLIVSSSQSINNNAALHLGDGLGGFAAASPLPFAFSQLDVLAADLDDNGYDDLVLTSSTVRQLQVRLHDGVSGFRPPVTYEAGQAPASVSAGDVNGDGDLDLVNTEYDVSQVVVRLASPAGVFPEQIVRSVGVGVSPRVVIAADLDHDVDADLLVTRSNNPYEVAVYRVGCQP